MKIKLFAALLTFITLYFPLKTLAFTPTLPIIKITTDNGKFPGKFPNFKKRPLKAKFYLNNERHEVTIKTRGSSSSIYPKKQFTVKFDEKISLLGLIKDKTWVLNGPFADKSLMRNVVAYEQAASLFQYSPGTRWVELYLNDSYHGVYVLTEKIKEGEKKVNTPKAKDGGLLVKIDGGKEPFVQTKPGRKFTLIYPEPEDEKKSVINSVKKTLANFENSFTQKNYSDIIHVDSFIHYFLLQEMWKNIDSFRRSMHLYKRKDGKIAMGPVWDFDIAAGGLMYYHTRKTEGWRHHKLNYSRLAGGDYVPWFNQLLLHPEYRQKVIKRWFELRSTGSIFSDEKIKEVINKHYTLLNKGAAQRNFARWKIIGRPLMPIFFFSVPPFYKTWKEEVMRVQNYLLNRAKWMDQNIHQIGRFKPGTLHY